MFSLDICAGRRQESPGDTGSNRGRSSERSLNPSVFPAAAGRPGSVGNVSIYDIPVKTLGGEDSTLGALAGKTLLVVNVASKCGLTPQYTALEELHERLSPRGFSVVGFPCNQFGGQEPGTAEEIEQFCSTTYGVTFPMFEKIDVIRPDRHPIYDEVTAVPDSAGEAGDIQWNFEKFLLGPDGSVVARFRPHTVPDDPEVLAAIESNLPS